MLVSAVHPAQIDVGGMPHIISSSEEQTGPVVDMKKKRKKKKRKVRRKIGKRQQATVEWVYIPDDESCTGPPACDPPGPNAPSPYICPKHRSRKK